MLQREGGLGGLERGEGGSLVGGLRGIAGRIPDADALLQGGMSEELRNWDLWYVVLVIAITPAEYRELCYVVLITSIKGSFGILFAPELAFVDHCCPEKRRRVHRCFRTCLDWVGGGNMANTSTRGKDVSGLHGLR